MSYTRDFLSTGGKRRLGSRLGKRNWNHTDTKEKKTAIESTHREDDKLARKSIWWNLENEPPRRDYSFIPTLKIKSPIPSAKKAKNLSLNWQTDPTLRDDLNVSGSSHVEFLRNEATLAGSHLEPEDGVLPLDRWTSGQSSQDIFQQYSKARADASAAREKVRLAQASLNEALYSYQECTGRADALLNQLMEGKAAQLNDGPSLPEESCHLDLLDMTKLYAGQRRVPSTCYTPASLKNRISEQIKQMRQNSPCHMINE